MLPRPDWLWGLSKGCLDFIFQILMAASMKMIAYWDIALCSLVEVD
jgi:hypothetical protein